ncbi:PKD domain-containing protein [Methanococcoides seepicolus]|uniref:PKD domain-containing protein n=1 Tax=Methanococcoides seepicolus TaxID=2828780 RepID=A0A9E4ZIR5_9EURY|nr:PKD domain-containing protein [Methanococcoides seepicolus]MCM1987638.1 PKD domain-containing protein [Methanococcoides seepicolus]
MAKLKREQTGEKLTPGRKSVKCSFTVLLLLLCLGTGMAAGEEIYFEPGDTTLAGIGDTETLNFYLDQAPSGLSGYNLTLSITDPSVARITGFAFPDWSSALNTNSELPANSVTIKTIDLEKGVNAGDTNVLLGTVTVESLATGEGNITVSITSLDDDNGNIISAGIREATMSVMALPAADFSADNVSRYVPLTVQFTDLSTNAESWSWDLDGDGIEDSTEQKPQFSYTDPGIYTVSLTVSNAADSDTETKVGYIVINDWNPWNDEESEGLPDGTYVTLTEVIDAYNCFRNGTSAPRTGASIDLTKVIDMYNAFRYGNPM